MKKRQAYQLLLFVLLFSFVTEIWIGRLLSISRMERLHENKLLICWKASLAINRFRIHVQKKRFANERRHGNRKRHGILI